jgi:PAS domain S-box-containing protein
VPPRPSTRTPAPTGPAQAADTSAGRAAAQENAQLRSEIAQLRRQLDDLGRLVSEWIWEVDRGLVLTAVSPRVFDQLGYHPRELVGRPFVDLVGSELPLADASAPQRARPFRDVEVGIPDREGRARSFRLSGLPVFDTVDGRLQGYRGTARDVTDLKAREAALLEAKGAAEQANRSKSQFLAQMSHELRTPLNAIIGFAEIMHGEALGPLGTPQYRNYAADIAESARHLSQVINDVLDVAKLEAGKFELHEDSVDPEELLQRAVRLVKPRAEQTGVALTQTPCPSPPTLRADGRKLLQVLLNLLSNAVKFTDAGGRVAAAARRDPDGGFAFEVTDTGIGMSAEDVAVALAPFGQVDSSLSRRYEGTGLGLPLAKALTELHDGRLELDSTIGAGTRIRVHLPAKRVLANAE